VAKSAAAAAAAPTAIKQSSELKPRRSPSAPSLSLPAASAAMHDLDRVIHERVRLGIISALAANQSLTFNDLKKLLDTTDGNLSVHARKLEEAGYILCSKSFEGRMP
jgi:DNA-binding transcriptional ArsR family regulator